MVLVFMQTKSCRSCFLLFGRLCLLLSKAAVIELVELVWFITSQAGLFLGRRQRRRCRSERSRRGGGECTVMKQEDEFGGGLSLADAFSSHFVVKYTSFSVCECTWATLRQHMVQHMVSIHSFQLKVKANHLKNSRFTCLFIIFIWVSWGFFFLPIMKKITTNKNLWLVLKRHFKTRKEKKR